MFRSAALLAFVLSHVAPHFQPRAEAAVYLSALGVGYNVDPLLVIAAAKGESDMLTDVINPTSGTAGLLQIEPMNFPACAATGERWSPECWTKRNELTNWRTNLRIGTAYFAYARSFCQKLGHGGLAQQWLQIPTGFDAVRHSRCGYRRGKRLPIPTLVTKLLARRVELERLGVAHG